MPNDAIAVDQVTEVPPRRYKPFYPWLVWGLGAAFFFAEYLGRVAPSVVATELMQAFHVSALSIGTLSGMFLLPYIAMQMPVGVLVDRYGPHKLLTITAALCSLGCFLFAGAQGLFVAEMGRFLMGFGAAFAFVGALKLATLWFCSSRIGLLAGLTQALGMFGAALGAGPLSAMVEALGWRTTMVIIGVILAVIAVLIGLLVSDHPDAVATRQPSEGLSSKQIKLLHSLWEVLKNPQSWINGLYVGLVYAPTGAFAELWGVTYLTRNNGFNKMIAAEAVSLIFLGWAVGGPLAGMLSDRIKRRKPVMIVSAVLSLFFMAIVLYMPNLPISLVFFLMFMYGVANTGVGVSYALSGEINPRHVAGTSIAFANMASIIIAALFQPLIGWFLDLQWDGKMVDSAPFYTAEAFRSSVLVLPACLALGIIVAFFVKETYCKIVEK